MSNKPYPNPLSTRNILSFIGANLTLGTLLGWVANLIQVLTFTNGLWILFILLVFSSLVFSIQLYNYQRKVIGYLEQQLTIEQESRESLQRRLDKLVIEFRSRSSVNPRPTVVNAFICTKKLQHTPLEIQVIDITPKLIVINKGEIHGLTYGMSFAIYRKGNHQCLETCVIDRVETNVSWLLHSGTTLDKQIPVSDLSIQLVAPDIKDEEREIAEILLLATGFVEI